MKIPELTGVLCRTCFWGFVEKRKTKKRNLHGKKSRRQHFQGFGQEGSQGFAEMDPLARPQSEAGCVRFVRISGGRTALEFRKTP
ncbi:MAG: hypothetical protein HY842_04395 [Bacteroidetes bacterium]|nr:hypothetical protein [Bacteroidota bacterium]